MENIMKNYEFINGGSEIRINRQNTPYPWVNYLTNTQFSVMISQAGGGFAWYKSPEKFRITRYRYNNLPTDTPGFYIYIRESNGDIWCPTFHPMNDAQTERYTVHRAGETRFYAKHGDTDAVLSLYILPNNDTLVWDVALTNNSGAQKDYEIFAYAELSQFDWNSERTFGYYWQHMLRTKYDHDREILFYNFNYAKDDYRRKIAPLVYFASDKPVISFSGDRDAFVGDYRSEANPIALEGEKCKNEEIFSGNPCAVLHIAQGCGAGKTQRCKFFLGVEEGALENYSNAHLKAYQTVDKLRGEGYVDSQKQILDESYERHFSHFKCDIPDKDLERQINVWGPLNAMQFSLFHQTPQPSAPGVRSIGARDKLQALMPMAFRNPDGVKKALLFVLSTEYVNGAIAHNISGVMHEYFKIGAFKQKNIKSDDHLWAPFLAYSVAAESDTAFLEEQIPYCDLDGNPNAETGSVWEHLVRIAEFTQTHLGEHGLPLMLDGDWNDIISKFSHKGRGESVFAAQQYVAALEKLIELAEYTGKTDDAKRLTTWREAQIENILKYAWNGKWWIRCFDDEGNAIGRPEDTYGKLWLNPQSWAVISGVGSEEQQNSAFGAVESTLDTGYGLTLLNPGFKTYPEVSDPFSPYNPGTGENGAIFCHSNTWAIIAEAKRGNAEKAWKYYGDLVPARLHEHLGTDVYKSDPYGWVSNIVGPENPKHGWGNVIRMTGTASWMNIAATQYLLGVRTKLDGVKFDPCILAEWDGYTVQRDYRGCRMNIVFKNARHVSKGVVYVEADGKLYDGNTLPSHIFEGKEQISITVNMA